MLVKDAMNTDPYIIFENDTVLIASRLMKEEKIRNIPVVDKEDKLLGLITLREIIETVFKNPEKILVKDAMIMLEQIKFVTADKSLKEAIEVMLTNKYGCLPVVDKKGKLIGMLTESDLLKTLYEMTNLPDVLLQIKLKK